MEKKDIVIDYIKKLIKEGKLNVGDKLESENVLAEKLSVSRVVVREALGIFTKNGTIEKKQGWGSLVVNTEQYKQKKYIIISVYYKFLMDDFSLSFKYTCDMLAKAIKKVGYTPFIYIENPGTDMLNTIKLDIHDIGGVISLLGLDETMEKIVEKKIPVVSVLDQVDSRTKFPAVCLDYFMLYYKMFEFIKNCKNVIFFNFSREHIFPHLTYFKEMGFEKYLSDHYIFHNFEFEEKIPVLTEKVKKVLNSIDYNPDALVIIDENLIKYNQEDFQKFLDKHSDCKIITQSTTESNLFDHKNLTKLEFDLDKNVDECMKMLLKLINKEQFLISRVHISPNVINAPK